MGTGTSDVFAYVMILVSVAGLILIWVARRRVEQRKLQSVQDILAMNSIRFQGMSRPKYVDRSRRDPESHRTPAPRHSDMMADAGAYHLFHSNSGQSPSPSDVSTGSSDYSSGSDCSDGGSTSSGCD
jgi:hypothetical protein